MKAATAMCRYLTLRLYQNQHHAILPIRLPRSGRFLQPLQRLQQFHWTEG